MPWKQGLVVVFLLVQSIRECGSKISREEATVFIILIIVTPIIISRLWNIWTSSTVRHAQHLGMILHFGDLAHLSLIVAWMLCPPFPVSFL